MTTQNHLIDKIRQDLTQAQKHLAYSYNKVTKMQLSSKTNWSEEELEVLESFAGRFARTSDLVIAKFLRHQVALQDPAFRGSIRDLLNAAEKAELITSAATWYRIRELRNVAAHEYATEDLGKLYQELVVLAPVVLSIGHTP